MQATEQFKMRLSPIEKLMLSIIAQRNNSTQAAVLKKFIRDTYRETIQETTDQGQPNHEQPAAVA